MNLLFICDPPIRPSGYNTGASQVIKCLMEQIPGLGHSSSVITKEIFASLPEGKTHYDHVAAAIDATEFDHIHLATQTRLGFLARRYCVERGLQFTSEYHAQYPEFLQARHGIDPENPYRYLRWFHNRAKRVLVPTPSMAKLITERGIRNAVPCLHGVNTDLFRPGDRHFLNLPRPIWLYVGRLDPEKSVDRFLSLPLPGTKLVVGDGSIREQLEQQFPDAVFVGLKLGEELAAHYAAADVFVFPSRTDTFGLVMFESIACGTPVAAFPVPGPIDVVSDPQVGCLDEDLYAACMKALTLSRRDCRQFAERHSWREATREFLSFQFPCRPSPLAADFRRNPGSRLRETYGRYMVELERQVVHHEGLLFGGNAHNLAPRS